MPRFDRGERLDAPETARIVVADGGDEFIEVSAPLNHSALPGGHVRLGYFRPRAGFAVDELPFLASLALAVFLLTPIFYFLARKETRPIRRIAAELAMLVDGRPVAPLQLKTGGAVGEFVGHFNRFAEVTQSRLNTLDAENTRLLTSGKLFSYQRQRLERVLEALPDVVLLLDETGTVIFANGKLRGLLDVAPEEVLGRRPDEWCKDRKIVDFIQRSEGKVLSRQLAQTLDFTPEGMPNKVFAVRVWPLLAAQSGGAATGKLLVFRDVTTEHLAARSRGEFVGHLAHELKTPLNVLAMYSEQLQGGGGADENARIEAVNAINDEVHRLAALIDNLLNITRIEMGSLKLERQRVNLKDLLQDAFNHVARSGRERALKFVLEVPENIPGSIARQEFAAHRAEQPAHQCDQVFSFRRYRDVGCGGDGGRTAHLRRRQRDRDQTRGSRPHFRSLLPCRRRADSQPIRTRPRALARARYRAPPPRRIARRKRAWPRLEVLHRAVERHHDAATGVLTWRAC